jgi:hypothetical protein
MRKRPVRLPRRVLRRFFDPDPLFDDPPIDVIGPPKD